ncbi:hypothetical protein M758_11G006700 [Ceratodon purpureus]|nr:hypothetical protein M758_11G006700 [Ceratodon purpureus]
MKTMRQREREREMHDSEMTPILKAVRDAISPWQQTHVTQRPWHLALQSFQRGDLPGMRATRGKRGVGKERREGGMRLTWWIAGAMGGMRQAGDGAW